MKKLFLDLDGTLANFNVRNALERFDKEIGFFERLNAYVGIEIINDLAKQGNLFVVSASPNEQADKDKMKWIKKYLPNLSIENVTICRIRENKAKVIKGKYSISIDENCFLLDDYTKNLNEWESFGGIGIKRLTSVADNSRGLWRGLSIKHLKEVAEILA